MKETNHEYQKAVDYLCHLIEEGTLRIGDRLPTERTIAETLLISRNSTREALRSLENMGAIESRRGSGNYLTGDMEKSIAQLVQMMLMMKQTTKEEIGMFRRSMEKAVCFALIEKDNNIEWIQKAEQCFQDWLEVDIDQEIEKDREFHYLLIQATKNQFWITLMGAINDVYRSWIDTVLRDIHTDTKRKLYQTHLDIVEAIKKKDKAACEKAINEHYDWIDKEQRKDTR